MRGEGFFKGEEKKKKRNRGAVLTEKNLAQKGKGGKEGDGIRSKEGKKTDWHTFCPSADISLLPGGKEREEGGGLSCRKASEEEGERERRDLKSISTSHFLKPELKKKGGEGGDPFRSGLPYHGGRGKRENRKKI